MSLVVGGNRTVNRAILIGIAALAVLFASLFTIASGNQVRVAAVATAVMSLFQSATGATAAAPTGVVFISKDGRIDAVNADTGAVLHEIQVGAAGQSVFMSAPPNTGKLFLTESVMESGTVSNVLDVYLTSDWTLEKRASAPDIIRYTGNVPSGILASSDGRFVYVYNYNDRTRGSGPVQYWVMTYDVNAGAWLPGRIDMQGCGASQLLQGTDTSRLFVVCSDSRDIRVVDTRAQALTSTQAIQPVAIHSGTGLTSIASAVVSGNNLFAITENREVHELGIAPPSSASAALAAPIVHENVASSEKVVPFQPTGIQANSLFVPSGSPEERSHGLSSRLVVVDARGGQLLRTIQTSTTFRWVTFTDDGQFAFLALAAPDQAATSLVRLDLQKGTETTLLSGTSLGPGYVISR
jgi:DNA-binding beta-propeller fold protein YncE